MDYLKKVLEGLEALGIPKKTGSAIIGLIAFIILVCIGYSYLHKSESPHNSNSSTQVNTTTINVIDSVKDRSVKQKRPNVIITNHSENSQNIKNNTIVGNGNATNQ
jgi:hypothetical protein